ncbi:MAG: hypothetical protein M9898_00270 [Chitinophagaceae bacterium]|nr:hypothetical protein [Chitinophagaceae bacterium]
MKKVLYFLTGGILFTTHLLANNILVDNANLSGKNTSTHTTNVTFDVSWENSWRTSTNESNYDGAWIFVKYRKNGTNDWRHATITSATGATGASTQVPADGKGIFIYRDADGIGNVNFTGNTLLWNYGADGLLDNETVEIRVFALEMVYIPAGSFYLGSGGTENYSFRDGNTTNPYLVSSNDPIPLGNSATGMLNPNGLGALSGDIPSAFPKGYNAIWTMKYECSQQQFVDFLNHLDLARANANNVNLIFTGTHPNLVAPAPDKAMNGLGFLRTSAFADWSGLRPMSELEFEKICRGHNNPAVPNEYVWGNTSIVQANAINNNAMPDESVNTPVAANANIGSMLPYTTRVGIFARTSGSTRELSGGTYYGVMNMGDNVSEVCFSMATADGLAIDASVHGDGYLDAAGSSDISEWTKYQAYGARGGAYNTVIDQGRISERLYSNYFSSYPYDVNTSTNGFRLVRSAL